MVEARKAKPRPAPSSRSPNNESQYQSTECGEREANGARYLERHNAETGDHVESVNQQHAGGVIGYRHRQEP